MDEDPAAPDDAGVPHLVGATLLLAAAVLVALGPFRPVGAPWLGGIHGALPVALDLAIAVGVAVCGVVAARHPERSAMAGVAAVALGLASAGGGPIGAVAVGAFLAVFGGLICLAAGLR